MSMLRIRKTSHPQEQYDTALTSLTSAPNFDAALRNCISLGKKLPPANRENESKRLWSALSGASTCNLRNRLENSTPENSTMGLSNLDAKYTALSQFASNNFRLDESLKYRALVSAELLPKGFRYDAFIKAQGEVTGFAGYHGGSTVKPYLPRDVAEAVIGLEKSILAHLKPNEKSNVTTFLGFKKKQSATVQTIASLKEKLGRSQDSWVNISRDVQPDQDQGLYTALNDLKANNGITFTQNPASLSFDTNHNAYTLTQGENTWNITARNKAAFDACSERLPRDTYGKLHVIEKGVWKVTDRSQEIKAKTNDERWKSRYSSQSQSKYYWLPNKMKASDLWFQASTHTPIADKFMKKETKEEKRDREVAARKDAINAIRKKEKKDSIVYRGR